MVDSQPASRPAQVCRQPIDEMISSRRADVTTFPAILLRISPTPIGQRPGFLSRGISRDASSASIDLEFTFSVHSLFIIKANVLHRSDELAP